jgi:N-acetylglucosamine-6-phosphate deacetylase
MSLNFSGGKIYTESGVVNHGEIVIADGKIAAIGSATKVATRVFPPEFHIVPGFIDLHVHGARGHDVMDANSQGLATISKTLAAEGTTAFLATTMTADVLAIENALVSVRDYMQSAASQQGAAILGVHLEGPFIAAAKMGAQRGDKILLPDIELVKKWQALSDNNIKLVTLAPEFKDSIAFIKFLREENIIASLGHTNATYAEAIAAIAAGCTHATHLFNAMRELHHREPGVVTAALLAEAVTAELILDGVHLHPAIVQLALKMKGVDNIVLVTDAMRAKCLADGCYDLGGQEVDVANGQARLADGTLAGSVLTMQSALQNILRYTGCDLTDALKMVAANPAKSLGIFASKGSIRVGKDADLVVLDEQLNVMLTCRGGEIVFEAVGASFFSP